MSEHKASDFCVSCHRNRNTGKRGRILKYRHNDILFNVEVRKGECDSCAIDRHKKVFEKVDEAVMLGILDTQMQKNWVIRWGLVIDARETPKEYEPNFYYRLIDILTELRIFTVSMQQGVFAIMSDGGDILNPRDKNENLVYFFRLIDVMKYARCLRNTQYNWSIVEFGGVTKREDVVR